MARGKWARPHATRPPFGCGPLAHPPSGLLLPAFRLGWPGCALGRWLQSLRSAPTEHSASLSFSLSLSSLPLSLWTHALRLPGLAACFCVSWTEWAVLIPPARALTSTAPSLVHGVLGSQNILSTPLASVTLFPPSHDLCECLGDEAGPWVSLLGMLGQARKGAHTHLLHPAGSARPLVLGAPGSLGCVSEPCLGHPHLYLSTPLTTRTCLVLVGESQRPRQQNLECGFGMSQRRVAP